MDNSLKGPSMEMAMGPGFRTQQGPESRTCWVQVSGRKGSRFPDPYKGLINHRESPLGIDITKTVASPDRRLPVDNYKIRQWVKVAGRAGFALRSGVAR